MKKIRAAALLVVVTAGLASTGWKAFQRQPDAEPATAMSRAEQDERARWPALTVGYKGIGEIWRAPR